MSIRSWTQTVVVVVLTISGVPVSGELPPCPELPDVSKKFQCTNYGLRVDDASSTWRFVLGCDRDGCPQGTFLSFCWDRGNGDARGCCRCEEYLANAGSVTEPIQFSITTGDDDDQIEAACDTVGVDWDGDSTVDLYPLERYDETTGAGIHGYQFLLFGGLGDDTLVAGWWGEGGLSEWSACKISQGVDDRCHSNTSCDNGEICCTQPSTEGCGDTIFCCWWQWEAHPGGLGGAGHDVIATADDYEIVYAGDGNDIIYVDGGTDEPDCSSVFG